VLTAPVSEGTVASRRRLRVVLLVAVICGLTIVGAGIWWLSRSAAAGQNAVGQITVINPGSGLTGGPDAVTVTRDGEVWVAYASGTIEVFAEPNVGTQGGGERVTGSPDALVASPRRAIFYAGTDSQITSTASYGMGDQWTVPAPGGPGPLAISPDGKTLYAASQYRDIVRPVNTATGHAGPPISTGYESEPVAMIVSPDGRRLYVANELFDSIKVINTAAWRGAAGISLGGAPYADALAISPDGAWLYAADLSDNSVLVVSTATGHVRAAIKVGRRPVALALTRDGRTLYVANDADNTVTPINTATRSAGAPIPVGSEPDALAITPDGHYLYVANFGDDTVSQLQLIDRGSG
jgi:YVTN family beta-propeller protein